MTNDKSLHIETVPLSERDKAVIEANDLLDELERNREFVVHKEQWVRIIRALVGR
jgi:hypothetical protein